MNKILLVEDSVEIYTLVHRALNNTCEMTWVKNIEDAKESMISNRYSIILLDIELPDGNGLDYCAELNSSNPNQAIFILTSHSSLSDKVLGFTAGADDYITKPFEMLELKARIEAKLKKLSDQTSLKFKNDIIEIDKNCQSVKVKDGEKFVDANLTHIEFRLITYLSDRIEQVIPRDELLNEIWGKDVYVYARSVDTHVSKLRKKIGSASELIKSIHGVGYKFSEKKD